MIGHKSWSHVKDIISFPSLIMNIIVVYFFRVMFELFWWPKFTNNYEMPFQFIVRVTYVSNTSIQIVRFEFSKNVSCFVFSCIYVWHQLFILKSFCNLYNEVSVIYSLQVTFKCIFATLQTNLLLWMDKIWKRTFEVVHLNVSVEDMGYLPKQWNHIIQMCSFLFLL